jgi:hypothetical protein
MHSAILDLVGSHSPITLSSETDMCALSMTLEPFDAVHTFGKPAKPPHVGVRMPPVHEQLQLAANHFANAAVVVWCASHRGWGRRGDQNEGGEGSSLLQGEGLDGGRVPWLGGDGVIWGTLILTKQVRPLSTIQRTCIPVHSNASRLTRPRNRTHFERICIFL